MIVVRNGNKGKLVYFSKEDWSIVENKSKVANMTTSSFIRDSSVNGVIIKKDTKLKRELIYEINKIGININQVTEAINIYKNDCTHIERLNKINDNLQKIIKLIKEVD